MNLYEEFIRAFNDFIHEWLYAYKDVELKYVRIEGEETGDGMTAYPDTDWMYILWANGTQSRIYVSESSTREILIDFFDRDYEDVPEDEYI